MDVPMRERREVRKEVDRLRAEVERLTRERDEWKAKWIALAQAAMIVAPKE